MIKIPNEAIPAFAAELNRRIIIPNDNQRALVLLTFNLQFLI